MMYVLAKKTHIKKSCKLLFVENRFTIFRYLLLLPSVLTSLDLRDVSNIMCGGASSILTHHSRLERAFWSTGTGGCGTSGRRAILAEIKVLSKLNSVLSIKTENI